MEKVKVNIIYNYYSGWYYATANRGRDILVTFQPGINGDIWYFRVVEKHNDIFMPGTAFPVAYLKELLQAVWLIRYGVREFPEIEFTVEGQKILKKLEKAQQ